MGSWLKKGLVPIVKWPSEALGTEVYLCPSSWSVKVATKGAEDAADAALSEPETDFLHSEMDVGPEEPLS